jgi:hypothetical protein
LRYEEARLKDKRIIAICHCFPKKKAEQSQTSGDENNGTMKFRCLKQLDNDGEWRGKGDPD